MYGKISCSSDHQTLWSKSLSTSLTILYHLMDHKSIQSNHFIILYISLYGARVHFVQSLYIILHISSYRSDLSQPRHCSDGFSVSLGPGDVGERHPPGLADHLGPRGVAEVHIVGRLLDEHGARSVSLSGD